MTPVIICLGYNRIYRQLDTVQPTTSCPRVSTTFITPSMDVRTHSKRHAAPLQVCVDYPAPARVGPLRGNIFVFAEIDGFKLSSGRNIHNGVTRFTSPDPYSCSFVSSSLPNRQHGSPLRTYSS
jgi:hypothetical protein